MHNCRRLIDRPCMCGINYSNAFTNKETVVNPLNRRNMLLAGAAAAGTLATSRSAIASPTSQSAPGRRTRFGVSTYAFWQFKNDDLRPVETCIDLAAEWGFDGVEILEMQLENTDNGTLQKLKQRQLL